MLVSCSGGLTPLRWPSRPSPALAPAAPLPRGGENRRLDRMVPKSLPGRGRACPPSPASPANACRSQSSMEWNDQPLRRTWEKKPALLVTISLSGGQTLRYARDLRRLSRRFEGDINTVIIYVLEATPINAPSPYTDGIWETIGNEIAGLHSPQPQTLEERIEGAYQLRRRFRLSTAMLLDALDNRAWRALSSAPNVALLVPTRRPGRRQGRLIRATENGTHDHGAVEKPAGHSRLAKIKPCVRRTRIWRRCPPERIRATSSRLSTRLARMGGRRPLQHRFAPRQGRRCAASNHSPINRDPTRARVSDSRDSDC